MLRRLPFLTLLVTFLTAVPWRDASGQDPSPSPSPSRPAPGQRVRVHVGAGRAPIEGTVVEWAADTLVIGPLYARQSYLDTLLRVPRASIIGYQPSLGRDHVRGFVRGAKVGVMIGGGVGLALVIAGIIHDKQRPCVDVCIPAAVVGGVLGVGTTLGGLVLGAALGALGGPEVWGEGRSITSTGHRSRSRHLTLVLSIGR